MALRPYVDHDLCVSSGACVLEFPEAFAYQEGPEELAIVLPRAAKLSQSAERLSRLIAVLIHEVDGANDATVRQRLTEIPIRSAMGRS